MAEEKVEAGKVWMSALHKLSDLQVFAGQRRLPTKTRIICTIGPKTNNPETLAELRKAGMSIMRMNFSHGDYDYHFSAIENLRKSIEQFPFERPCAIALDTKGAEIRTGLIKGAAVKGTGEVSLKKGQTFVLTTDKAFLEEGDENQVYVDYLNLPKVVKVGDLIYIDDGLISLEVKSIADDLTTVTTEVLNTAKLGSKKGVNLPNVETDLPAVTEKDRRDLEWGVEKGVDIVFASFIRRASDVQTIREVLGEKGAHIKIISKIENHEGVKNFDEILALSDGIMVARGDLGIEIPAELVFVAQKMMIAKCNVAGKPVICATQMLESMTYNPRPTRAEVSDVANAVLDGADCVMLSGETAKGDYPIDTVRTMANICREAERTMWNQKFFLDLQDLTLFPTATTETVALAAVQAAFRQQLPAIIILTTTGASAALVAKYRPSAHIIAVTRNAQTAKHLMLHRGIYVVHYSADRLENWEDDVDARLEAGVQFGKSHNVLDPEHAETVVMIQGWTAGQGKTNTLRLVSTDLKERVKANKGQ